MTISRGKAGEETKKKRHLLIKKKDKVGGKEVILESPEQNPIICVNLGVAPTQESMQGGGYIEKGLLPKGGSGRCSQQKTSVKVGHPQSLPGGGQRCWVGGRSDMKPTLHCYNRLEKTCVV